MFMQRATVSAKETPAPTAPTSWSPLLNRSAGLLQRKCACGGTPGSTGECEECREKRLQQKIRNPVPPIVHEVLNSPGQPLDADTRAFMEPRFSHDFGHVRVHTDAKAADSARAVNALAYTVGRNVVFARGRYEPNAERRRGLLAHELTHTIQQRSFASAISPQEPINIEPPATSLEQAAEECSSGFASSVGTLAPTHHIALQRQPAPQPEIEMPTEWAFAADKRKRTWRHYARSLGKEDAARIRKKGKLTPEDRAEVNAKIDFFQGDAMWAYIAEVKPALVEVTREEIEMPPEPARPGPAPQAAMKYPDWDAAVGKFFNNPNYIDNDIKTVSFFTAELAQIHYRDGAMLELGLVPKWMKPPFEEVDYHTPGSEIRPFVNAATGEVGFFLENELANVPRTMTYAEMQKRFLHPLKFAVVSPSGRIVPTRVNMRTAPTLCGVLLDQERQFVGTTKMVAEMGEKFTAIIGMYAGAGGYAKPPSLATTGVTRTLLSPAGKKLATEMEDLLAKGGSKTLNVEGVVFEDVTVAAQGSRLAVRRFKIQRVGAPPGHGSLTSEAFEDAAVSVARTNGLKSVTIDVGVITNPGWREWLESLGYVYTPAEGGWIKTIILRQ
jgi:hypothetical protein